VHWPRTNCHEFKKKIGFWKDFYRVIIAPCGAKAEEPLPAG